MTAPLKTAAGRKVSETLHNVFLAQGYKRQKTDKFDLESLTQNYFLDLKPVTEAGMAAKSASSSQLSGAVDKPAEAALDAVASEIASETAAKAGKAPQIGVADIIFSSQ